MTLDRHIGVSSGQKALWAAQRSAPDLPNNISGHLAISGPVDHLVMDAALRHVCHETPTLRVRFGEDHNGVHQTLCDPEAWGPDFFDISRTDNPESVARCLISDMTSRAFDLSHDILYRAGLIKLDDLRHALVVVAHRIVCDGFGLLITLRRISEVYTALKLDAEPSRPRFSNPEMVSKSDSDYRSSEDFITDKEFWTNYTHAWPEPIIIAERPTWPPCPATLHRHLELAGEAATRLKRAADGVGLSLPRFLTASLVGCLSRASSASEFPIRLAVANRLGVGWSTPCMLSNAVPVRVTVAPHIGFVGFAKSLEREIGTLLVHTRYRIPEVQCDTDPFKRQGNPFGPVINVLPFFSSLDFAGSRAAFLGATFGACDDLSISAYYAREAGNGEPCNVHIQIDANGLLYTNSDLDRLADQMRSFLQAVITDPEQRIDLIEIIDPAERGHSAAQWNRRRFWGVGWRLMSGQFRQRGSGSLVPRVRSS